MKDKITETDIINESVYFQLTISENTEIVHLYEKMEWNDLPNSMEYLYPYINEGVLTVYKRIKGETHPEKIVQLSNFIVIYHDDEIDNKNKTVASIKVLAEC